MAPPLLIASRAAYTTPQAAWCSRIDADGALTEFFYDGAGRVTDEMRFATRISIAASVGALDVATVSL